MKTFLSRFGAYVARLRYQWFKRRGYRNIVISYPNRIGHQALEVDALIKDSIMAGKPTHTLLLKDIGDGFANRRLVDYFRDYITVCETHPLINLIDKHGDPDSLRLSTADYAVAMYQTAKVFETFNRWGARPPLFVLKDEDRLLLANYLAGKGLGDGDWYVCLHARGGGYSPGDERFHTYRNVDVLTYDLAVEEIVRRGGWCIRMGDPTMPPYQAHPRVIDYALSADKTPELDVALSASCRFFLGSASGLANLAQLFGAPCAVVNVAPLSAVYALNPADLSIPQKLEDASGRILGLKEIMGGPFANLRITEEFVAHGLRPVSNSREDIRDLAVEMLDRLDGAAVYNDDDRSRQDEFRSWFHEGHYSFRSAASIGRDFLQQNM